MSAGVRYVVITPVRNEENNLPRTIESVVSQSYLPAKWIIIDDGSTDATPSIADAAAVRHPWIRVIHRQDRGFRQPGTGVVEAFYDGLTQLGTMTWDFLVKLDGDLIFDSEYFEFCFDRFDRNPQLGIGGGLVCRSRRNQWIVDSGGDPAFHVRGATKIYRRACWEQIGGLISAPGWDTVDELKANMLGWETCTFGELKVYHLKDTGSADGSWKNWAKNGLANYITGYHPLFMAAKCLKRTFQPPYMLAGLGLAWGFLKGYLTSAWRVNDPMLIQYLHRQQINRLRKRPSLWDQKIDFEKALGDTAACKTYPTPVASDGGH